ncbi:MAG: Gfo/Idh/MocA family oxidoreductase [Candidatus Heimdallarchaeota archaeon]|nr:Gfo/Idh/MocA family oxidoreductase [Candidatus Heimdallarchaeota archaeon]
MVKTIAIIGVGQIGSRHLQGLTHLSIPSKIFLVDPIEASLDVAIKRYNEIEKNNIHELIKYYEISELPKILDLAIIATSSDIRADVLKLLLKHSKISFLILEKIGFQSESEFEDINILLQKLNIPTWFNCPRRIWSVYKKIKIELMDPLIDIFISGSNIGIGSNLIHFLDLFTYLTENLELSLRLDPNLLHIENSKRMGFIELSGYVNANTINNQCFTLRSYNDGSAPIVVTIQNKYQKFIINESEKQLSIFNYNENWKILNEKISIPYQSELTGIIAEEIFKEETCSLTLYQQSMPLQLDIIKQVRHLLKTKNFEISERVPIT